MENELTLQPKRFFYDTWLLKTAKYFEILKISFLEEAVYPINLATDGFVIFINIWIYFLLYQTGYELTGNSSINGLTVPMVIWILTLAKGLQESRITAPQISESIQDGTFAYKISRPYSYIYFMFFRSFGQTLPYLLANIAISSIFCRIIIGPLPISAISVLAGILLFMLGFLIDFYISMVIGLMALWIEKTDSIWWLYGKLKLTLGGVLIPIALLPDVLRKIAEYLPFSQIFYTPVYTVFQFQPNTFFRYLAIECFWVLLLGVSAILIFRKGMKYVTSNGG